MTAYLVIRNDDISYFTNPQMVKSVHEIALNYGFKISFAVIPRIECSMDLCIPPEYRGKNDGVHYIPKEIPREIIDFIKKIKGDVLLHGFNHNFEFPEFRDRNKEVIQFKIDTGKKILDSIFGFEPKVFVPPQEDLSKEAWEVLSENEMAICRTCSFAGWMRKTPKRYFPLRKNIRRLMSHPTFFYKRQAVRRHMHSIGGIPEFQTSAGFCTLRLPKVELNRAIKALDEAVEQDDLCQIALHSWEFFEDWDMNKPRTELFNAYNKFLEYASRCDILPITLTNLMEGRYADNMVHA